LRSGTNFLRIDSGPRLGFLRNKRSFQLCRDSIEDEAHFLLHCPILDSVRITLFLNIVHILSSIKNNKDLLLTWSINKLWFLYGSSDITLINNLILNFITISFNLRKKLQNGNYFLPLWEDNLIITLKAAQTVNILRTMLSMGW